MDPSRTLDQLPGQLSGNKSIIQVASNQAIKKTHLQQSMIESSYKQQQLKELIQDNDSPNTKLDVDELIDYAEMPKDKQNVLI